MIPIVKNWSQIKLGANAILLLGNGASRAIDNDAFDYTSLLSLAKLSEASRKVFELIVVSKSYSSGKWIQMMQN